jgi:8-oxo-dGTP pyrophosphatase MutT (NUDIX family)
MHNLKKWKIKKKNLILNTKIFDIFNLDCFLPSKNIDHGFYSININDWINIFALTKDNKVILVKQHRLGKDMVTIEVPAGAIDENEKPEDAARRELAEETGYTTENLIQLKKISVNPAIQTNNCYFFLALDCKKTQKENFDLGEEIEVVLKDKSEVFNSVNTDLIDNSLAFLSILLARDYLRKMVIK